MISGLEVSYFLLQIRSQSLFFPKKLKLISIHLNQLPLLASVLMFLPLFIERSQQFHPWYLLWPLAWIPLIKNNVWKLIIILFSITSLLRYIPWLYMNDYTQQVILQQKIITWSAPVIALILILINRIKKSITVKPEKIQ